jgi:arabinofuranan 3-O-arabinosyltransferase
MPTHRPGDFILEQATDSRERMSGRPDALSLISLPDRVRQAPIVRFVLHPTTRYVLAWLLALGLAAGYLHWAWHFFNEPRRNDGNNGHTFIDFGGQWVLGRMVVEGHGRQLYNRSIQRELILKHYPRADEIPPADRTPEEKTHDAEDLFNSFMSTDDKESRASLGSTVSALATANALEATALVASVAPYWDRDRLRTAIRGGPLYPPVHAVLFSPLSGLTPRVAYRIMQILNIVFAFVAGLGISWILKGRVWFPIATAGVILYSGFPGTICLGQNAPLTLAPLVWGWTLLSRGRPVWGGVVWGLLVYKPVWAAAFFLVPLLTGRWRMCLAMMATAAALIGITLPIVGWHTWIDWLHIGRLGSQVYDVDQNLIFLSRDLLSIPRRWLLDFAQSHHSRDRLAAHVAGWTLLIAVFEVTTRMAVMRREDARAVTGPGAAFLLLGAWLCCFHFMYYDVLLTALPVFLLFAEPKRYLQPVALRAVPVDSGLAVINPRSLCLVNSMVLTLVALLPVTEFVVPHLGLEISVWATPLATDFLRRPIAFGTDLRGTPWNTFVLFWLWLWCAWLWVRDRT